MRAIVIMTIAVLALAGAPAFAESSLTGTWKLTTQTQQGPREATLTVLEPDGILIANLEQIAPEGATGPGAALTPSIISDIVVDGDHFTFKRTMSMGQQSMVFDYDGTVDGDTLTARAKMGDTDFPVTGVRE